MGEVEYRPKLVGEITINARDILSIKEDPFSWPVAEVVLKDNQIRNLICKQNDKKIKRKPVEKYELPERHIINEGATILFWGDKDKTIVKRSEEDEFDPVKGFLWAYFQKTSGMSKTKANNYLRKIQEDYAKEDKEKNIMQESVNAVIETLNNIFKPR